VHNYLTKSRTYQGLDWMWKPDEVTTAADVNNAAFLTRNLLISSPHLTSVYVFLLKLYLIFAMITIK